MHKKNLQRLVQVSFNQNTLDQKKVERIAQFLTRKEIKKYIRALKKHIQESTVTVTLAESPSKLIEKQIQSIFLNKKIVFKKDPTLLLGARIVDNDMIFDMTLKNNLEELIKYVSE